MKDYGFDFNLYNLVFSTGSKLPSSIDAISVHDWFDFNHNFFLKIYQYQQVLILFFHLDIH